MGLADHEIPAARRKSDELNPEDITAVNRPVYLAVIGGLVLALIFGLVAWFVLAMSDKSMPDGMAVLLGTIGGGLVGLLTGSKKS